MVWRPLAETRPPQSDYRGSNARYAVDPALGLFANNTSVGYRRIFHAIHGPRRMGSGAGPFERVGAGRMPRNVCRFVLPIRQFLLGQRRDGAGIHRRKVSRRARRARLRNNDGGFSARRFPRAYPYHGPGPRGTRERILVATKAGWRQARTFIRRSVLVGRLRRCAINVGAETLFDNCLGDSIRQQLAILRIARSASFTTIA